MDSNNCARVLKLGFHGRTVLFPSDIQDAAQRALLKNPRELKCDVLVAPHHGSAEAMTPEFLRAAAPSIILASNDRKLAHKGKTFDVLASGYPLYRTSRCGAITLSIDAGGQISVRTFLGVGPQTSPPASNAEPAAAAAEVLP
jgi:competence protein ComEC